MIPGDDVPFPTARIVRLEYCLSIALDALSIHRSGSDCAHAWKNGGRWRGCMEGKRPPCALCEGRVALLSGEDDVVHGTSCPKAHHILGEVGYLHPSEDDAPYDVDGVAYCGRCHFALC